MTVRYSTCTFVFLFLFLFLLNLSVFCQEPAGVRVGVSAVASGSADVSDFRMRNELVKAINERKPEKAAAVGVVAVALDAPPGGRAIAEAKAKDCAYVLYVHLRSLHTGQEYQHSYSGYTMENRATATATVEYLVRRVSDGATYAGGTGASQPSSSPQDAILEAVHKAGDGVVVQMAQGGSTNPGKLDEVAALEKMTSPATHDASIGTKFCAWLPSDVMHPDALVAACEYAMTLPERMPNFICRQETSRFVGRNRVPTDMITANIRYEDGDESYSDFALNGKPVSEAAARSAGLWSGGQFEGNLRDIFHSGNHATFAFSGENRVADHAAWVFTYRIAHQDEPLWQLRANQDVIAPAYSGELWVDQKTANVLRFTAKANDLAAKFPMEKAAVLIDYENVPFGDGTAFVLPVTSSVATQFRGFEPTRNLVQFHACHKFRAKARMLLGAADRSEEKAGAADLRTSAPDEEETLYAVFREQAIRDDAAEMESEQEQELKWASINAFARLAALEKERRRYGVSDVANAAAPAPASMREPAATFRTSARLVPVSVVVRDPKGRVVGNLTKTDFQLFDERKLQTIGSFSVEKAPVKTSAREQSPPQQGSPPSSAEEPEIHETNNVAYVFDDIHSSFEDIENARDAEIRHLDEMRAEDQAAVFTTSGMVSLNFTPDREKLKSALHALKSHERSAAGDCPQMSYYMADLALNQDDRDAASTVIAQALECTFHGVGKPDSAELEKARQVAMAKAFEMVSVGRVESQNVLAILQDVITATAAMPGKRSIVLVSPGFLTTDAGQKDRAMMIIDQAVRAGVVVNTLDVRGVLTTSVSATDHDLSTAGEFERRETTARDALMADFAYGTGGVFFHNNNDLALGFKQTAEVPEYIYVLGFSPQKLDGKFHKLRVKLSKGESLTVQARAGYYAMKPASTQ